MSGTGVVTVIIGLREEDLNETPEHLQYVVGAPLERIAIDVLGPLPETEHSNKYLLIAQDYH